MHLFNLHDFGQRYGIDLTVADFNSAVTQASIAATQAIASRFRFRDFGEYTARKDIFRIDRMFGQPGGVSYQGLSSISAGSQHYRDLRLARGFVITASGFSIYAANDILDIRNNTTADMVNLQDVNEDGQSDHVVIDSDRGVVSIHGLNLTGAWVVVTYNCGMTVATDDEFEDVPDWLREAAEAQALLLLKHNRSFKTDDGIDEMKPIQQNLDSIYSSHARVMPGGLFPISSEPGR